MYNLVHTTRFWNNHYHVSSKSQIGKPVNQNIGGFWSPAIVTIIVWLDDQTDYNGTRWW